MLISRHDPPLALPKLRLDEKLNELRFSDLAFMPHEARPLLAAGGIDVPDETLQLMTCTGGWAAAEVHASGAGTGAAAHTLWFEHHEVWMPALEHALASADWDFAGAVAMRSGAAALFGSDREQFLGLISTIPAAATVDNPELGLAQAVAAYCGRDMATVASLLKRTEPGVDKLPEPRSTIAAFVVELLHSGQAHRDGDGHALQRSALATHELLVGIRGSDAPGWAEHRGITLNVRGVAELWAGDPARATALIRESLTTYPPRQPNPTVFSDVYTRGLMAVAEAMAGHMVRSAQTAEETLELAERRGLAASHDAQWAWLAQSLALLQAGDLDAARAARQRCSEVASPRLNPFVRVGLNLAASRQYLSLGELVAARRTLDVAAEELKSHRGITALQPPLTALRVDLAIAEQAPERAHALLTAHERTHDPVAGDPLFVMTAKARLWLATGQAGRVRETVAEALDGQGPAAVNAWLAVSAAEDQQRRDSHAVEAMSRALDLASTEAVLLPLLRPTRQLASSLRRHLDLVRTHRDLVTRVLATATDPGPHQVGQLVPLPEREMAVLLYLPTMGSNAEIAEALCVSENTVKQHLKSIYRKLGVGSRREAVRVARSAGLFDEAALLD